MDRSRGSITFKQNIDLLELHAYAYHSLLLQPLAFLGSTYMHNGLRPIDDSTWPVVATALVCLTVACPTKLRSNFTSYCN